MSTAIWWKSRRSRFAAMIAVALAAISFSAWWLLIHPYVRTDDARVAAVMVRVAPEAVGGRLIKLHVKEGDAVKKGTVLAELDHRITEAKLKKAKAKSDLANRELKRTTTLVAQRGLAPKELDLAKASAESAEAELQLAQVALDNTTILSPLDGVVIQKSSEVGNIIEPGQTILTVANTQQAWISANIEETEIGKIRLGQDVRVTIDEGGHLTGHVSEIHRSVASQFALIPSDNGSGSFTKVVQRVPIKVELDAHPDHILRAGQSVEIKIKVN